MVLEVVERVLLCLKVFKHNVSYQITHMQSFNSPIMFFHIHVFTMKDVFTFKSFKRDLSEAGFEPAPGEPDCALTAAP